MMMRISLVMIGLIFMLGFVDGSVMRGKSGNKMLTTVGTKNDGFNSTLPSNWPIDHAWVALYIDHWPTGAAFVNISGQDTNCYQCRLIEMHQFTSLGDVKYVSIPTRHPWQWVSWFLFQLFAADFSLFLGAKVVTTDTSGFNQTMSLGDAGVYALGIVRDLSSFNATVLADPSEDWLPIVVALIIYTVVAVSFAVVSLIIRRYKKQPPLDASELLLSEPKSEQGPPLVVNSEGGNSGSFKKLPVVANRLWSLDTFRGICLAVMIFVNYDGGSYWFFNHSVWNGLTVADLVFPWFIFLMGASIAISMNSIFEKPPVNYGILCYKIFRRAAILFILGIMVNGCYNLSHCRIPGVLQRFSISYLVVAFVVLLVPRAPLVKQHHSSPILASVYGANLFEWILVLLLVVVWILLTFLLPVPGCPTGYLGPGGLMQANASLAKCTGGSAFYIDKLIFGINHIYHGPTCQETYECGAYDPEGLLGCLTSIFLCYLGVNAGRLFIATKKYPSPWPLYGHLGVWGVLCGVIGTALAAGSQNNGVIPIAKNLWSLSFVLVMGGMGFLALGLLHEIVDRRKWWAGAPFRFMGMNSIALYFSHEILGNWFPLNWQHAPTHAMSLLRSLVGTTLWIIAAYYCYIIGFFVKI